MGGSEMIDFFNKHKNTRGVISIMLSLLLLPIYSLTALLIESGRIRNAQQQLDELNYMGSMSVLAGYVEYVQNRFGLLAFESKGGESPGFNDTTFRQYVIYCQNNGGVDTLALNRVFGVDEGQCSVEYLYSLAEPEILKNQIMQYGKYIIPATLLKDVTLTDLFKEMKDSLKSVGSDLEAINSGTQAIEKVADLSEKTDKIEKAIEAYENSVNDSNQKRSEFISALKEVRNNYPDMSYYSDVGLTGFYGLGSDIRSLKSERKFLEGFFNDWNNNIMYVDGSGNYDTNANTYDFPTLFANINSCFALGAQDSNDLFYTQDQRDDTWSKMCKALAYIDDLIDYRQAVKDQDLETKWNNYKPTLDDVLSKYKDYVSEFDEFAKALQDAADSMEALSDAALGNNTTNKDQFLSEAAVILRNLSESQRKHNEGKDFLQTLVNYKNSVSQVNTDDYTVYFTDGSSVSLGSWNVENELPEIGDANIFHHGKNDIAQAVLAFSAEDPQLESCFAQLCQFLQMIEKMMAIFLPSDPILNKDLSAYASQMPSSKDHTSVNSYAVSDEAMANAQVNKISSKSENGFNTGDMTSSAASAGSNVGYLTFCDGLKNIGQGVGGLYAGLRDCIKSLTTFNVFSLCKALVDVIGSICQFVEGLVQVVTNLDAIGEALSEIFSIRNAVITLYATKMFPNRVTYNDKDARDLAGNQYPTCKTSTLTMLNQEYMFNGAQLEYMVGQSLNESANQELCYMMIFAFRALLNIIPVLTDKEVQSFAAAANIGAPAVYILWVLGESYADMVCMLSGCAIPLVKFGNTPSKGETSGSNLITSPSNLALSLVEGSIEAADENAFTKKIDDKEKELQEKLNKGTITNDDYAGEIKKFMKSVLGGFVPKKLFPLTYDYYIFMLIIFQPPDTKVQYIADLIQMEYWANKGNTSFSLDHCYTYMRTELNADYNSVLPVISMGEKDFSLFKFKSIKYNGY